MINPENITAGLCSQTDFEIFIPEQGKSDNKAAKAICKRCVEIEPCFKEVIAMKVQPPGIWAGLSKRERDLLKRNRRSQAS
jgi:Transcription factor WhiB